MKVFEGVLKKMKTIYSNPIIYTLSGMEEGTMNDFIGREIAMDFIGYECLKCKKNTKIFRQGHCYKCFYESPATASWVIRPEDSKAHLGIEERNLEYEKEMQLQPHVIYLAKSSHVKVGITRKQQIPTRWIDQGASQALPFLEVPNRYLSGVAEVALKEHISDKTNWRKMLTNVQGDESLEEKKEELLPFVPEELQSYVIPLIKITEIIYPVKTYPTKVQSLSLEKQKHFTGVLSGIKGQYLIFDKGIVFNVRSNEGKVVTLRALS